MSHFSETIFSRAGAAECRPLLLIEHPTRINGEESNMTRQATHGNEEQAIKAATSNLKSTSSMSEETLNVNSDKQPPHQKEGSGDGHLDSEGSAEERSGEKQHKNNIMARDAYVKSSKTDCGVDVASLQTKPETETLQISPSPAITSRPMLEDNNIVLGVALDGVKRMLPIEEGMGPSTSPMDSQGIGFSSQCKWSWVSKEKKDSPNSAPGGSAVDQRVQEG